MAASAPTRRGLEALKPGTDLSSPATKVLDGMAFQSKAALSTLNNLLVSVAAPISAPGRPGRWPPARVLPEDPGDGLQPPHQHLRHRLALPRYGDSVSPETSRTSLGRLRLLSCTFAELERVRASLWIGVWLV